MKCKTLMLLFNVILICSCVSEMKDISVNDSYLIVPGKSAEGYILGADIINNSSMTVLKEKKSISEILNVNILPELRFDSVLYIRDSHALLVKDNKIVAIAGLKIAKRVTSDAVLLSKGIDNFIMNYGNEGLKIVMSGNHKAYIYKDSGIAVFDDNNDNIIDMYLVFN